MKLNNGLPLLVTHFVDHRIPGKARIIDQDIQTIISRNSFSHDGRREFRIRNIAGKGDSSSAGPPSKSLTITLAPCSASNLAVAEPMPRPLPVTMAILPSIKLMG
jgi:hypothetical protein